MNILTWQMIISIFRGKRRDDTCTWSYKFKKESSIHDSSLFLSLLITKLQQWHFPPSFEDPFLLNSSLSLFPNPHFFALPHYHPSIMHLHASITPPLLLLIRFILRRNCPHSCALLCFPSPISHLPLKNSICLDQKLEKSSSKSRVCCPFLNPFESRCSFVPFVFFEFGCNFDFFFCIRTDSCFLDII